MNHFRHCRLKDNWVIIAPNRAKRPELHPPTDKGNGQEAACPFEPGHESQTPSEIYAMREGSQVSGWQTRVFPNKYPLLQIEGDPHSYNDGGFDAFGGFGAHEVLVDTPDHYQSIHQFGAQEFSRLFRTMRERSQALYQDLRIRYVQHFKNCGKEAGSSIAHSHAQIIGLPMIPPVLRTQIARTKAHYHTTGRCLLCDEIAAESQGPRLITKTRHFLAYAPYASFFPFEVRVVPLHHHHAFETMPKEWFSELGTLCESLIKRLDTALETPNLNMILHSAPPEREHPEPGYFHHMDRFFHWYLEFLPRLEKIAGFELGSGMRVNVVPPEEAAHYLRSLKEE